MNARACVCTAPMHLELVESARARIAEYEVQLQHVPIAVCARCGRKAPPIPDFHAYIIKQLMSRLPLAQETGVIRKRLRCCACHAVPSGFSREGETTVRSQIDFKPGIGLQVSGPALRCPACGKVQFPSRGQLEPNLVETLEEALRSAGIEETAREGPRLRATPTLRRPAA